MLSKRHILVIKIFDTLFFAIVIIIFFAIFIMPMFLCSPPKAARCLINLRATGNMLLLYADENNGYLPTNRQFLPGGRLSKVSRYVKLSETKSPANKYGYSWVDGILRYAPKRDDYDPISYLHCPTAKGSKSKTAFVSYVLNRNLVEQNIKVAKNPSHVMMLREMDRLVNSELRPINDSRANASAPPISPFLTDYDVVKGKTNKYVRKDGSCIGFLDGHVFWRSSKDIVPKAGKYFWDPVTHQWYNDKTKLIAITP